MCSIIRLRKSSASSPTHTLDTRMLLFIPNNSKLSPVSILIAGAKQLPKSVFIRVLYSSIFRK
ncbi:wsv148 [White spot syndrome virus]|uniref:Wsv148 n=4 Tax=White spot syndrome virus TaxID=342409 RepID=Q8VB49_WSSVS|nr:wsv148 [Shrimp white spot syndrome virus]AFX59524.1 wsv148 [White spot syndrome virus]AAL33152.1 wsv148 [Shrimp white spot syndrome virus]AAL89071.1 WSSV203 [Shrimp white spot syndrome virus]AWQ60331.1 wsv148 [Shrimp white spot syndrome virus]AWQ61157.1 wsv148 [Shrimp white spot syndrome virus]